MHIVIFTGGIVEPGTAVTQALAKADKIIAADSGAKTALSYNKIPEIIIGDFDSLDEQTRKKLEQKGSKCISSPAEKNETDTELAIQYAIDHKVTQITILGGIEGNRIDHIFANISLAADAPIPLTFISGATTAWVEKGPKEITIKGKPHDLLSLIPLTAHATNIQTKHVQYPLTNETLFFGKSRGMSNVFLENNVSVKFTEGTLLFVHINKKELIENSTSFPFQ